MRNSNPQSRSLLGASTSNRPTSLLKQYLGGNPFDDDRASNIRNEFYTDNTYSSYDLLRNYYPNSDLSLRQVEERYLGRLAQICKNIF